MRREILCYDCVKKLPLGVDLSYESLLRTVSSPQDQTYRVSGKALMDFLCDHCGEEIHSGDICTASSIWIPSQQQYFSWEEDYIEIER